MVVDDLWLMPEAVWRRRKGRQQREEGVVMVLVVIEAGIQSQGKVVCRFMI